MIQFLMRLPYSKYSPAKIKWNYPLIGFLLSRRLNPKGSQPSNALWERIPLGTQGARRLLNKLSRLRDNSQIKYIALIFVLGSCNLNEPSKKIVGSESPMEQPAINVPPGYLADAFDYPVGKPDAKQYYNAQPFGKNYHLGDDWNGKGGGNTDLGDPVYAIGNGYVRSAKNYGGDWGNIIRVVHFLPDGKDYESLYAHCDKILVKEEQWVKRGDQIGTIGNVGGKYYAHLHFEIREDMSLPIGSAYAVDARGYLDPTEFIERHRRFNYK